MQVHDHTYGTKLKLLSVASLESVDTMMYCQIIGSLMYLTDTRPDICFTLNTLRHVQLIVAKHIMRYLKGKMDYGLKYEANQKINLEGYEDSYWACNAIDRKST